MARTAPGRGGEQGGGRGGGYSRSRSDAWSRRAARSRSLAATRRPNRPAAAGPAGERPSSKASAAPTSGPESRPESRRRGGRQIAPRAGERRRAAALVLSPLTRQIVALGLALCAVALSLAYPLRGYLQQQAAEAQAIAEQHDLESQIKDLNAQIAALKDPAYIRAEAKRRLQYVTPGDTVYVVKVPGAAGAAARQDSSPAAGSGYDAVPPGAASNAAPTGPSLAASGSTGTPGSTATTGQQPGQQPDGAGPWYSSLWGTLTGARGSSGG